MISRSAVTVYLLLLTWPAVGLAIDLDSCASDLEALQSAARDAHDAAEEASSKQQDLEDCRDDPEVFDLMGDHCASDADDYRTAVEDLKSELDTVDRRFRWLEDSCGVTTLPDHGRTRATPLKGTGVSKECSLVLRYKGKLPLSMLLESCGKLMTVAECSKCLGVSQPPPTKRPRPVRTKRSQPTPTKEAP